MKTETKHTQLPWSVDSALGIMSPDGGPIAYVMGAGAALDAALIVRAVNSHEDLLAAIRNAMSWIANWDVAFDSDPEWIGDKAAILQVIAAAETEAI